MYLKSLEIQGFKSIADRTTLLFQPGITAIVGPNGSGKSNIADSLRWVMGEHNIRNIRGSKLEDIIFTGSEERKPLGMAAVTLLMDNSDHSLPLDFTEVSVARRIYRSGESEFYINQTPARLKDIQELFYDTGLGKENYSIISQGKIDSILSLRPEERRAIFEEAAGIMKYKSQKALTVKKLVETESSLLRIEDIMQEIETQIEPLYRQSEEAKAYLQMQKELRILEINQAHRELRQLNNDLQELETKQNQINCDLEELNNEEITLNDELSELKEEITQKEEEANDSQRLLMEQATTKERAVGRLNLFDERRRFLEERRRELGEYLSSQSLKVQELQEKHSKLQTETENIDTERSRLSEMVATVKERLFAQEKAVEETRERLEQEKLISTRIIDEIAHLRQSMNETGVQNDFRQEKKSELRASVTLIEREIDEGHERISLIDGEVETTTKKKNALEKEEGKLRVDLAKHLDFLKNQEEKNQEIRGKLRNVESRITLFEEMEETHQGYFQGVKALLKATDEPFHKEIHGIVADLIKVKPGYEIALEVALGSSLQNLVISHDRFAREAIKYLKAHSLGRATFFPLNLIDPPPNRLDSVREILTQFRCLPAASAVTYQPQYQGVILQLLGRTIIAPDLSAAVAVAERTNKKFFLVTMEGEVVAPGGAITGGKLNRGKVGLLSRRSDIEQLKKERKNLLAFMNRGLEEEKKLKERISGLNVTLEEAKSRLQELVISLNSLVKDEETASENLKRLELQKEQLLQSIKRIDEEIFTQAAMAKEVADRLQEYEEKIEAQTDKIKRLGELERQLIVEKEEYLRELSELSSRLAGIQQEWLGKESYLKEQEANLQTLLFEVEQRKSELARTDQDYFQLNEEKEAIKKQIEASDTEGRSLQAKLEQIKGLWQKAVNRTAEKEGRLREIRNETGELTAESHRFDLKANRISAQIERVNLYFLEEYGKEWAAEVSGDWSPPSYPKQEIERMKNKIREMAPVNLQAIEDYQRQKERMDFLTKQYNDLTSAQASMEEVIHEIEKTIKKCFLETFDQVKKAFAELFERLFNGGEARLELLEEENPLESGIEILAQPPGKRLQSLSLLSGGERAMTAIALLFAVLRVKPTPFCILDEIDATLDDANIKRFTDLLSYFSQELQFVIITHRRATMEIADTLYGVTMEDKGVSKLVSLQIKRQESVG